MLVTLSELKEIYCKGDQSKTALYLEQIKRRLDETLLTTDWDADDVIQYHHDDGSNSREHDYSRSHALDCIIYYTTGF